MKKRILSGMRPTGKLHLGHLVGALKNWVKLQDEYECYFMVADWHALMSEYENASVIRKNTLDNVVDWISCGIDPKKSTIFVQSDIKEHLELAMVFSSITPLGWLARCPTYKEQLREVKNKDLHTYAFLGYPVLQAADILIYKADAVPVGQDQLPHLEITREIARRFNHLYKPLLPKPEALLTKVPKLLGIDGRKMSKAYDNAINLSDSKPVIKEKVQSMFTDPQRIKRTDIGRPEVCNVYSYFSVFAPEERREIGDGCRTAKIGCTECKQKLGCILVNLLEPIHKKRKELLANKRNLRRILQTGEKKAKKIASRTISEIKKVILE